MRPFREGHMHCVMREVLQGVKALAHALRTVDMSFVTARWTDHRRADWLGHTVEDHDALTAAAR